MLVHWTQRHRPPGSIRRSLWSCHRRIQLSDQRKDRATAGLTRQPPREVEVLNPEAQNHNLRYVFSLTIRRIYGNSLLPSPFLDLESIRGMMLFIPFIFCLHRLTPIPKNIMLYPAVPQPPLPIYLSTFPFDECRCLDAISLGLSKFASRIFSFVYSAFPIFDPCMTTARIPYIDL
jgi:hypothetical protein